MLVLYLVSLTRAIFVLVEFVLAKSFCLHFVCICDDFCTMYVEIQLLYKNVD